MSAPHLPATRKSRGLRKAGYSLHFVDEGPLTQFSTRSFWKSNSNTFYQNLISAHHVYPRTEHLLVLFSKVLLTAMSTASLPLMHTILSRLNSGPSGGRRPTVDRGLETSSELLFVENPLSDHLLVYLSWWPECESVVSLLTQSPSQCSLYL